MTNCNADSANDIRLPADEAISKCQSDAVILSEILLGIDMMSFEGSQFDNARAAITTAALDRAQKLADDLDAIELSEGS